MEQAACARVQLEDRIITLALNIAQLSVRGEGDLVTAEIISIEPPYVECPH